MDAGSGIWDVGTSLSATDINYRSTCSQKQMVFVGFPWQDPGNRRPAEVEVEELDDVMAEEVPIRSSKELQEAAEVHL